MRASMLPRFDDIDRTVDNLTEAVRFLLRKLVELEEDIGPISPEEAPLQ